MAWDRRTGRPLHNAIVWQDTRTADLCTTLAGDEGIDRFRAQTGLPGDLLLAPKMMWLLANVAEVEAAARRSRLCFGTIDSWILFHLTGGRHLTDVTNALDGMLFDLERAWDEELADTFGVPIDSLLRSCPRRLGLPRASGC